MIVWGFLDSNKGRCNSQQSHAQQGTGERKGFVKDERIVVLLKQF